MGFCKPKEAEFALRGQDLQKAKQLLIDQIANMGGLPGAKANASGSYRWNSELTDGTER
jgi:hypothetical protein